VGAALHRDLPALKLELARAQQAGKLDRADVTDIAEAVVAREIHTASGESGVRRVRALRACARPVLGVLRERSSRTDEVAAEAMLVRVTQNDVSTSSLVKRYAAHGDGAWRAVAARASVEPEDVLFRRRWFADPDRRVRRASLEAAMLTPEPGDLPALLETLRLDPDPLSRSLAARAAGAIGGEHAVVALSDRLARADEADRLAIVDALAMPAAFSAGGERELYRLAEDKHGVVSISAARALLTHKPEDGALAGLLLTAIEHGSEEEQRLALSFVPLTDPRTPATLDRAAVSSNPEVRVMALARLLALPARKAEAEKRLRQMAAKDDSVAEQARAALAASGDRSVVAGLVRDLQRGHASSRQAAAVSLFRLGEPAKAATALGDDDPGVRLAVSCAVLAAR